MRKQKKYEEVKKFVEGNGNGCKLLSTEWVSGSDKLRFLCKCGNEFETTFGNFKGNGKRQCNECGAEITRKKQAHSYDYVKEYIEKHGCELLSKEYYRNSDKLLLKCRCGKLFNVTFGDFQSSGQRQCNSCGFKMIADKQRLDYDFVKHYIEVISDSGCKLISEEYINNYTKLDIMCSCGRIFKVDFTNFKDKDRTQCKKCSNITYWNYEEVKHYIEIGSGSECKLLSDVYINSITELLLKCACGCEFLTAFAKFQNGKMQCSPCGYSKAKNNSKGEGVIDSHLKHRLINFQRECSFEDLVGVGGGLLRFDFSILDRNGKRRFLIEYDGEFHFKKFYEEQNFDELQIHDKRKNQYCKDNNIPLLRIPYWQFDKIEQILDKWLSKYGLIHNDGIKEID